MTMNYEFLKLREVNKIWVILSAMYAYHNTNITNKRTRTMTSIRKDKYN